MNEFIANSEQELPKKEGVDTKKLRLVVNNPELKEKNQPSVAQEEVERATGKMIGGIVAEKILRHTRGGVGSKGDPMEIQRALKTAKDDEQRLKKDIERLQADKNKLINDLADLRIKEKQAFDNNLSSFTKKHIAGSIKHVQEELRRLNGMLPESNPADDHAKILNIIKRYTNYERMAKRANEILDKKEAALEKDPGNRKLIGEANRAKMDLVAAEGEMRTAAEEARKIEGSDTSRPYQNDDILYTHQASEEDARKWKKLHGNAPDAGEKVVAGVLGMTEEVRKSRADLNGLSAPSKTEWVMTENSDGMATYEERIVPTQETKPAEVMATVPADANPDERLVLEVGQGSAELAPAPTETSGIEQGEPAKEEEQRILRTMADDIALAEKEGAAREFITPAETSVSVNVAETTKTTDEDMKNLEFNEGVFNANLAKTTRVEENTEEGNLAPSEETPIGTIVNSDEAVAKMEQMLSGQEAAVNTPVDNWQEKAVEDSGIKTPDWGLAPKEPTELELVPIEAKSSTEMTDEELQKLREERMEAFNSLFGINGKALVDGTIIAKEMEAVDARAAKSGMRMLERVRDAGVKWNKLPPRYKWLITGGMLAAGSGAALAGSAVAVGAVGGMRMALSAAGGAGAFAAIENILKTAHEKKTGEPRTPEQESRHTLLAALAATVFVGVGGSRAFDMMTDALGGEEIAATAPETEELKHAATPDVMSEEVGGAIEESEMLKHATTPETLSEETPSSAEIPQPTPQNTFTPDNPYVLQYADQFVSNDMQKLFGQKGVLGFGAKPWNEVLDISDPDVGFASKTVSEILNAETGGAVDESMQRYGIQNDAAVGKMREYIENTMKKSGVLPAPDEKLFDFLRRAAAKKISEAVSNNG